MSAERIREIMARMTEIPSVEEVEGYIREILAMDLEPTYRMSLVELLRMYILAAQASEAAKTSKDLPPVPKGFKRLYDRGVRREARKASFLRKQARFEEMFLRVWRRAVQEQQRRTLKRLRAELGGGGEA